MVPQTNSEKFLFARRAHRDAVIVVKPVYRLGSCGLLHSLFSHRWLTASSLLAKHRVFYAARRRAAGQTAASRALECNDSCQIKSTIDWMKRERASLYWADISTILPSFWKFKLFNKSIEALTKSIKRELIFSAADWITGRLNRLMNFNEILLFGIKCHQFLSRSRIILFCASSTKIVLSNEAG